jgi:citrate synthase
MAALAVGAGQLSGGREVFLVMEGWAECGTYLDAWRKRLAGLEVIPGSIWPAPEHAPGFDPHGVSTATSVKQTLSCLARFKVESHLMWLKKNLAELERAAGCPLALSGVAAAAFFDLGFTPAQGEMLHLMLRLPGAAAHALEQRPLGYKKFPFGTVELEDESTGEKA